jgi:RNA polymerase sigma-70 factor (ECF subfamily)
VTRADSERKRRFDALFREHVAGIASYCGWRSRTAGDGEDAVAEVFLIAWRRLDDVPEGSEARPWLYGVARRVLANQARADARRVRLNAELGAQSVPVPVAEEEDPRVALVHEALAALAPRDREVLLLADWEGLAPAEIARVMQIPRVTARGRLHRARRHFRAVFESLVVVTSGPVRGPVSPLLMRLSRE